MSRPALTPEQRRAALAPGSVAVVAGAGTGKTHMLAHRYLHHLEQGLSPLQIVAVTFTEKAAAELRARIRSLVRREAAEAHAKGDAAASWRDALAELEAAQISTLHALAARICRDHPDAAGVPPDFAVLEELERDVWTAERLEEALAGLPPEALEGVPFDVLDRVLPPLLAEPLEAERALEHGPDHWRALMDEERGRVFERARTSIDWGGCRAVLEGARGDAGDKGEQARRDCLEAMDAFERQDVATALACVKRFRTNAGSKKAWDEAELRAVQDALKMVKGAITDAGAAGVVELTWGAADDELAAMLPALRAAFRHVRAALDGAKRRARVLDFADLEVHALRALEHEEVRRHYAERWGAFLVDEFQDTNPVQARLLDLLLGSGARMTIVGDEKQAIYGFRGADVRAFRSYRRRIVAAGGGEEVVLDRSFRSRAGLVADLNAVFGPVLGALHQDLRSERAAPEEGPAVTFRPLEAVDGVTRTPRLVAEAHAIAGIVRELVESRTPVHDKATGALRPARYGDVAVLARTWRPFDTYAEVLPALGVPAVHTGGGDLLDTREAKDGLAALRFLADPDDDVALVALLRSPFFALDDRTLHDAARALLDPVAHAHAARRGAGHDAVGGAPGHADPGREGAGNDDAARADPERDPLDRDHPTREDLGAWWRTLASLTPETAALDLAVAERLERPRRILADLLARKRDAPPSRLLQRLDDATGYGAVLANLPGAGRRVADWRAFAALVRQLERGNADVFAVARRLRRLLRAGVAVPRPELRADDAVALMTVHHAKGLEWPIVIVADLAAGAKGGRGPDVLIERDAGVALKLEDDGGDRRAPGLYTVLDGRRRAREEAEERRVLYVALTRARDRVVLTADAPSGGPLDRLADGLQAAGIAADPVPFDAASTVIPDPPVPAAAPPHGAGQGEGAPAAGGPGASGGRPPLWDPLPPEPAQPVTAGVGTPRGEVSLAAARADAVWDEVLALAASYGGAFEASWAPYLEAVRDAGAPPPDPNRLFSRLLRDDRATGAVAVAVWGTETGAVALVPGGGTPDARYDARYDARLVRADPDRFATADLAPLLQALGVAADAP